MNDEEVNKMDMGRGSVGVLNICIEWHSLLSSCLVGEWRASRDRYSIVYNL